LEIPAPKQLVLKIWPAVRWLTLTRTRQILLALVISGTVLRLYLLGGKSIWLDEAYSIVMAQHSLYDMLKLVVRTDTRPPLSYLMLKIWLLFSQREAWVRLLSAIFSSLSIPLMYLLTRTLFRDKRAGLLGAAILAFSPFQIWYAQETRMYAALTFFVLASALFFFRALRSGAILDWLGYALMTVLALYTDNGAIWYLATLVVFSLFYGLSRLKAPFTSLTAFPGELFSYLSTQGYWKRVIGWLSSHLAIGFCYLFWLPFLFLQTRQVMESFWLPPPSFQTVLGTFLDFQSYNFPWIEVSLLYMATIFVFAYIVPGKSWQRRLASLWLFLPVMMSLLLSLRQPIFLSRNLIVASLGFYLLVTDTIWKFKSKKAVLALFIPLLALNLVSIGRNAWFTEKEDWREAAQLVAASAQGKPDGLVVFVPGFAELPFQYYFKGLGEAVQTQGYPGDELLLHPQPRQVTDIRALLEGRPYVWLVVRQAESLDPNWLNLKIWLDSNGYVRYPGFERENVQVFSYYRWDKAEPGLIPNRTSTSFEAFLPICMKVHPLKYIVEPGDSLLEIALRFNTTVEALAEVNHLDNPNKLTPGQTLIIP
jgi:mannosyltransferase